mmetsp:Transcript_15199/g.32619  ORF Transcript_15199/g.32619 Transcript_15199/m.32619 type:complete len:281 (-) Transcript_15199:994-1836(-)
MRTCEPSSSSTVTSPGKQSTDSPSGSGVGVAVSCVAAVGEGEVVGSPSSSAPESSLAVGVGDAVGASDGPGKIDGIGVRDGEVGDGDGEVGDGDGDACDVSSGCTHRHPREGQNCSHSWPSGSSAPIKIALTQFRSSPNCASVHVVPVRFAPSQSTPDSSAFEKSANGNLQRLQRPLSRVTPAKFARGALMPIASKKRICDRAKLVRWYQLDSKSDTLLKLASSASEPFSKYAPLKVTNTSEARLNLNWPKAPTSETLVSEALSKVVSPSHSISGRNQTT